LTKTGSTEEQHFLLSLSLSPTDRRHMPPPTFSSLTLMATTRPATIGYCTPLPPPVMARAMLPRGQRRGSGSVQRPKYRDEDGCGVVALSAFSTNEVSYN
jgi:hypothetical protein